MRCSGCGSDNSAQARFCEACGTPLARYCAGCGARVSPAARFCTECGRSIASVLVSASGAASRFGSPSTYTPRHLAAKIRETQAAVEGERKQVTVLFADIEESMQLLAGRDPEEARELLDPVLAVMMDAVHWYEGTVNQVMGDGIMALFGAPLAHEDHALRACYAALRMRDAMQRFAEERPGVAIRTRIGLNSGEVVVRAISSDLHMDYSAIGQTTHVAARMEQMAAAGTIVMTPATAALVEGYVHVRSHGARDIKGLTEPLELVELVGAERVRSRLQAHAGRLTKFVGRRAELDRLASVLEQVRGGHGHVVAVAADAGMGKSRLYREFLQSASARNCLVLETGCLSYRKAPYLPLVELLRAYFEISEGDSPLAAREKVTAGLDALDVAVDRLSAPCLWLLDVPVDDVRWQGLQPEERRQHALEAVRTVLLSAARRRTVIAVFEDLHWIDAETQALLDSLVASLVAAPLLLLVNYRPEYQHGWAGRSYYHQFRVEGLPAETADELLEALLGADPSLAPLKRLLASRTDGNPLFIEETVPTLRDTGALVGEPGACRLVRALDTVRVPPTVQAVIAARIDRLAADQKRLLQSAAVIGTDVPFALLRDVSDASDEELRGGLARLQAAELLHETHLFPDIEYAFRHTVTHDVAYGSVVHERRKALHARIAAAIERLHAGRLAEEVERLAHHAYRAEAWDKAVGYLRQAGEKALVRSASREAADWFAQALDALAHLPVDAAALRLAVDVRLDLRAALYELGELEPMVARLREAEALARELDDPRRQAWIAVHIGEYWRQTGQFDQALERVGRALELAEAARDAAVRLAAHQYLGLTRHAIGDYRRAAAHMRTVAEVPEDDAGAMHFRPTQTGSSAGFRAVSLGWLARCLAETGDFEEALAHGRDAVRIAEGLDHPYSLVSACWGLGYVHAVQGEVDRAVPVLERALATAREARATRRLPQVMRALGPAYARSGRPADGIALLEEALRIEDVIGLVVGRSNTLAGLGEAYLIAGRAEDARRAAARALTIARERGQRGDEAFALHVLAGVAASCAAIHEACRHYEEASALAGALGMRPLTARARLGLGMLLQRDGDPAALQILEEARASFEALAMPYWEARAAAALRGT
jgi:class 3 adenylate cyclase/tetratricopeptide (TPR) repeat protein